MFQKSTRGWWKHLDFIIFDILCLQLAFFIAYMIRHGIRIPYENHLYMNVAVIMTVLDLVVIFCLEAYKNVLKRGIYQEFRCTLRQSVILFISITAYLFLIQSGDEYSRLTLVWTALLYIAISYPVRLFWKRQIIYIMGSKEGNSLLILTDEKLVDQVVIELKNNNLSNYHLAGVALFEDKNKLQNVEDVPVVCDMEHILEYVQRNWVDEVFIAISDENPIDKNIVEELTAMGVTVHMNLSKLSNVQDMKQTVQKVGNFTVISNSMNVMSFRQSFAKRTLDILGGLVGCLLTGIAYLFVAPKIKKESPGPVFFKQQRVGKNGKIFYMYKFRSMYLDAEERKAELMSQNRIADGMMFKMEFDPRIIGNYIDEKGEKHTGIGEKIRRLSIDELPQFYNVLRGDMSLVGTRPPTLDEWNKYEIHHRARMATKPGITGMWQVSGRSNIIDFEEVVKMDTQYINNWSIGMDIKILLKTISVVFKNEGAM